MEKKKLEVVGLLKLDTDLSEFCKSDNFTELSDADIKNLVKKLEKNNEPVSDDLRAEIIEALSYGEGYTVFPLGYGECGDDITTDELRFISNILDNTDDYKAQLSIKERADWTNVHVRRGYYEFKLSTDIDYVPYVSFVKGLTADDIDLCDKIDNLCGGDDIESYKKSSPLYKMYQKAYKTGTENELFDDEGCFRDDIEDRYGEAVYKYIKDALVKDIEDQKYEWASDILDEMGRVLFEWESVDTQEDALTGALYNMDSLYLDALNSIATEITATKKAPKKAKAAAK